MATIYALGGFQWEANLPKPGETPVTKEEAEAAIDALSVTALCSKHGREAQAAMKMCDYKHALSCAYAADEVADRGRWV